MMQEHADRRFFALALSFIVAFAALAKGAHDLWAATIVQVVVLGLFVFFVIRRRSAFPVDLLIPATFFIAVLALATLYSIRPGDSVWETKDWFAAALFFVLARDVFAEEPARKTLLLIIWVVAAIELFLMIRARLVFQGPYEGSGTLINANIGAFFLLPWIPVTAVRSRTHRLWLVPLFVLLLALACTWSYSAFLVTLLAMPFCWFSRAWWRESRRAAPLLGGLVLAGAILIGLRHYQSAQWAGYASSSRIDWWKTGLRMLAERPLFGVGPGNYQHAFLLFKSGQSQNSLYAHNALVTMAAETGLVGLSSVIFFVVAWWKSFGREAHPQTQRLFALGLAMMAVYSLYNIGVEYLLCKLLLALFAGIALGPERAGRRLRLGAVVVVCGAAVAALPFLITPLLASQNLVYGRKTMDSDPAKAAEAFHAAVALDPLLSEAHEALAGLAFRSKNYEEAIREQREALRLDQLNLRLKKDLEFYEKGRRLSAS